MKRMRAACRACRVKAVITAAASGLQRPLRRRESRPVGWMRINLAILLIGIFVADVTRHIRITVRDREAAMGREVFERASQPVYMPGGYDEPEPTTRPATQPAPQP